MLGPLGKDVLVLLCDLQHMPATYRIIASLRHLQNWQLVRAFASIMTNSRVIVNSYCSQITPISTNWQHFFKHLDFINFYSSFQSPNICICVKFTSISLDGCRYPYLIVLNVSITKKGITSEIHIEQIYTVCINFILIGTRRIRKEKSSALHTTAENRSEP